MADETTGTPVSGTILVVGGGISGITTALEAAEVGYEVFIVEKNPYLGGRVAQLNKYFPKLCPPTCGLEINFQRIKNNKNVKYFTLTEIENISGGPGNYDVTLKETPRYVNGNCTCCGKCAEACDVEIPNDFNFGMDKRKAAYLPHEMAFPQRYVLDASIVGKDAANKCREACEYNAIDLDMQPKTFNLKVASIVWATGWNPYDAKKMDNLRFGWIKNVITNMMMERLAAVNGPTGGKIVRPSDGKAVSNIAFVQCAGSRDENHLPYCSYVCCLASLKQTTYIREQYPKAKVTIFYIDLRTPGRYEKFYKKVKADANVFFVKGKVAKIEEDPTTRDVLVTAENTLSGKKVQGRFDMVVLATGMEPSTATVKVPGNAKYDENNFVVSGDILSTGCVKKPSDVMTSGKTATGTALKAIQTLGRR
ncbi:MAG: CoB--CoM heterodisulfide reductase iron-sulfur subunit A family protein [Nitrospirota bacterium]|nr:CoB--CoM heterodisulfide reductase iron-sulfur subunit A family protein [Nitrospirota bacterium]